MMSLKSVIVNLGVLSVCLLSALSWADWTPLAVDQDPLVRMPGSQAGSLKNAPIAPPASCLACHANYDPQAEPGSNWKGSMMAQASRDFLYLASVTVAAQDSIWAVGTPNATDICLRCHFPKGWLEGRSDPTNASLMEGADWEGVQCDFCHRAYDPFFETTQSGTREGADWLGYWDEAGPLSAAAAEATYFEDLAQASGIQLFKGLSFFGPDKQPVSEFYRESGGGQYFISSEMKKRGPFADTEEMGHDVAYSRFHKSKYFCNSCHDVSNPILANFLAINDQLNPLDPTTDTLVSESEPASSYFHVERTFSEFMLSDYGQQGGADGKGHFAPERFQTSAGDNKISRCQDCHMPDVSGRGSVIASSPIRTGDPDTTESAEHPQSAVPRHNTSGGNLWVAHVLASSVAQSPAYDATNHDLLNQGAALLTLDSTQGIDAEALLAGVEFTKEHLTQAGTIEPNATDPIYDRETGALSFRVQNQTGHKLISGFPEGRRMILNIVAKDASGAILREINPYDEAAGTLKGLPYPHLPNQGVPAPAPLGPNETYVSELVYEVHGSSALTEEEETFHAALATDRSKDNRIPPPGFRIAEAAARFSEPRWHGASTPDYFSPEEYAGGFDRISSQAGEPDFVEGLANFPSGAVSVEIRLYYQTTSREYIEFLRDEIRGSGNLTLTSPTLSGQERAYIAQSDPFFSKLAAWGDTIWQLWTHNMNAPGAAPFLMAKVEVLAPVDAPQDVAASDGLYPNRVRVAWSPVAGATHYALYRSESEAGEKTEIAPWQETTTADDTSATQAVEYYYWVKAASDASGDRASKFSAFDLGSLTPESAMRDYKVTYKKCSLRISDDTSLHVVDTEAKSDLKIQLLKKPPTDPTPKEGTAYLRSHRIPALTIVGGLRKCFSEAPVGALHASGAISALTMKNSHAEEVVAESIRTLKMTAYEKSTDASPAFAATQIETSGAASMKIALTGVALENLRAPGSEKITVTVASKAWKEKATGAKFVSLSGMGRVTPDAQASGALFELTGGELRTLLAKGCSIVADRIVSAGPIKTLKALSRKLRGQEFAGRLGSAGEPERMHVAATEIGKIFGTAGVSGIFIAGYIAEEEPNYAGSIKSIGRKKTVGALEGEAHVTPGEKPIKFKPDQDDFVVYTELPKSE